MRMEDIAKLANVSKSAVSIALNGKPGIGAETRARIMKIAHDSGYIPRASAKPETVQSVGQTIRFIACTHSDIVLEQFNNQPFFMELIRCVEGQCRSRGYPLQFSSIPSDQIESHLGQFDSAGGAGGVILLGTNLSQDDIRMIAARQRNLVVLDTCFSTLNVNFIVMNNELGAYQAAKHLTGLGHKRIGYVQSSYRMYNFDARKKGFLAALEEEGLSLAESDIFEAAPTVVSSQESFRESIAARLDDMPTALYCECDYIAISVIKSLMQLGLRLPNDISVVGFDNIHEAMVITPELTTIHVEKESLAEMAVAKLIAMMEQGDQTKIKAMVDTRLVVRHSTTSPVALAQSASQAN